MTSKPNNKMAITRADKSNTDVFECSDEAVAAIKDVEVKAKEINGPKGLEPTRYGDWESKGRCYDF